MAKNNYCIFCGFKLFPEDNFCPNCGARVDEGVGTANKTAKKTKYEPSKVGNADLSKVNKPNKPSSTTTASTPKPKTTVSQANYQSYKKDIDNLMETYENKEKKVLELLEKKFPSGQISYYRFKEEVDSCRVNFYREADSAKNIIELSEEYSPKLTEELKKKISILKSINAKMTDLLSELIISISNEDNDPNDDIDILMDEMNELIDSVKDYE